MKFEPKKLLGHWAACPLCDAPKPEIKSDAKGNPYLWCVNPNCNVQIFTQGKGDRPKCMLAKMTPIGEAAPASPPAAIQDPAAAKANQEQDQANARATKKSGGAFRTLLNLGE